ncbi:AAA family ATPase [Aeromicrobium sp. YIM 150415]|uniref:HelD family protein n=1 Tax=Aeromicrobium sp. YIM 150415 TaxID=2803912 RepID=UPI0019624D80|nr:UvrD-helicase domain-containing protein [Aeromicrobium sp. YIM 150415]MBM9463549.1 AAA family ATPase [Aeromicrobium sp. YIM 150415]
MTEAEERAEIAAEQAYVDVVYQRLDASAVTARSLVAEGMARGHIGHEGGLVERDAMVYQANRRLASLDAAHEGLVFGRLDLLDGGRRYIGRIGVRDEDREILLMDWRAPAASAFYRATAQQPSGVVRRRVLRSRADRVIGVEDDLLDAEHAPDDMVVIGEGALLASLSRARDDQMHSVVATIQAEQDEAIRAPSRGATIITGGPGTGKTVVALHRAAYLLYTDRRRFETGGVLVVGPSSVFMNYIDRVLPSLGETAVTLRAIGDVVDGIRASEHDVPAAAAVKGSEQMATLLRRLARSPMPEAPREYTGFYRDQRLHLSSRDLRRIGRRLLSRGSRNQVFRQVPAAVLAALWSQVTAERALEKGEDAFIEELLGDHRFVDFVESWWPEVDAVEAWRTLPQRIAELAGDVLTAEEIAVVRDTWSPDAPRIEDVPLIDELRHLLGEVPPEIDLDAGLPKQLMSFERRERDEAEERLRTTSSIEDDSYAHLLVDEAQDLSPMQWRMLGRRARLASWTIVGDAAQSSWPRPHETIAARDAAIGNKPLHHFRLSKNYRNSAEIYDLAARVAQRTIDDPDLAEAVRRTDVEPRHEVTDRVEERSRELLDWLLDQTEGTVAVVAAQRDVEHWRRSLADVAPDRVRVLDGLATKGLEFDGVLVSEPDAIVAESAAGWRTLYVVLTRATSRLATVGTTQRWLQEV